MTGDRAAPAGPLTPRFVVENYLRFVCGLCSMRVGGKYLCVSVRAHVCLYIYCACITPFARLRTARNAYSPAWLFFSSSLLSSSLPCFLPPLIRLEETLLRCQPKPKPKSEPGPETSVTVVSSPQALCFCTAILCVNEHREDEMARVSIPGDPKWKPDVLMLHI